MIKIKISKVTLADPAKLRAVARPIALARVMADAVYTRVAIQGKPATAPKPYSEHGDHAAQGKRKRTGYSVTQAYAGAAGVDKQKWGSSADFHRATGTRPGTYRVTGKMWEGLQVRNFGNGAVIEFAGVSLGSTSAPRVAWQRVDGKSLPRRNARGEVVVRKPKNVRNWEKAGIVFRQSRVNVVQPTDAETSDMIDGISGAVFDAIKILSSDSITPDARPATTLARRFMEAISK